MWTWGLIPVLLVAVYTDWRWHRIYNWLTFPAFFAGLILSVIMGGVPGLLSSLAGAGIALVVFLFLYLFAKMGAGDLKLMVAIGAWIGYPLILTALVDVALAGGVISLLFALRYGALKKVLRNIYFFMLSLFTPGAKPDAMLGTSALPPFPYGVAIAAGTLVALFYPHLPTFFGR
ncbi:prepilin peptidase [bacterium]|nr:prepilin peptidase [bacterium]